MTEVEKQDIIEQLKKGSKIYTCSCGVIFSDMYDFRKHLLKKHKKEWNECFEKIRVTSYLSNKALGTNIIEKEDEYIFKYSTQNTFKPLEKKKKPKKKRPLITLESARRKNKKVIKSKKKFGNKRTFEDLFIPLTKHEAETGLRKEVINKLPYTEKKKKTEFVKIIYTPMGNKR